MTKRELRAAEALLKPFTDRTESIHVDGRGYALTAYWRTGGQRLLYTLEDVREHVAEITARA